MDAVDRIFELVPQKYREQKDFAKAIGEPASRVSEWKNRKSASYVKCIAKIAEALGTSVEHLLSGKDPTATLHDPLSGLDPEKDVVMIYKDSDGRLQTTPMVPKGEDLPADALEVAHAYMTRSHEVKNVVRAALGLSPISDEKSKIG